MLNFGGVLGSVGSGSYTTNPYFGSTNPPANEDLVGDFPHLEICHDPGGDDCILGEGASQPILHYHLMNFPTYFWNILQTPNQQFMKQFRNSFGAFCCMPGICSKGYVGDLYKYLFLYGCFQK